jgi:NADPH-dependent 2,4-dienoyl-CoA reductase/sulfur reductase-like enzyme
VSIVIVGGSVAGIATARALREYGYNAAITVLEAEQRQPYDKPPLSKEMLLDPDAEPVPLLTSRPPCTDRRPTRTRTPGETVWLDRRWRMCRGVRR